MSPVEVALCVSVIVISCLAYLCIYGVACMYHGICHLSVYAGSRIVTIDTLHFLARCHKRQLNQALSFSQYSYRQDAAKRQTASIKFTHRPKIRFFMPVGDSLHRFRSNFAGLTGN